MGDGKLRWERNRRVSQVVRLKHSLQQCSAQAVLQQQQTAAARTVTPLWVDNPRDEWTTADINSEGHAQKKD